MNLALVLPANLIEILIMHNYWYSMLQKRHNNLKSNIVYFTFQILNIIKCILIFEHVTIKALTTTIISLILMNYLFKDKWYKKLIVYTSYMVCVMFAEFFAVIFAKYIYNHDLSSITTPSLSCYLWQATAYLLIFIFTIIGLLLLKNKRINPENKVTQYVFLYISVQCLLVFVVTMLIFEYNISSPLLLFIIIFIFIASIFIGHIISKTIHYAAKQTTEAEFFKKEAEIKDKHFYELKEQYMEYKRLRHDFYNHIKIIEQLNDDRKLKDYVSEIKETLDTSEHITYCNNPTLDAILSIKKSEAIQAGITISHEICDTAQLTISDFDLCTIISNLLDNAIRAASETEKKFIHLQMTIKMERLIITVRNSSLPVSTDLKTTKNDKENHGLGLRNIILTSEKYDGTAVFNYENGEFISIVNLKN